MDNSICINNIYALSKQQGIKIGDLEESVELSKGYFARLKREGESFPAAEKLFAIAEKLHVSMDSLMHEEISRMAPDEIVAFQFLEKLYDDSENHNITWTQHKFVRNGEFNRDYYAKIEADSEIADVFSAIDSDMFSFDDYDSLNGPDEYIDFAMFYTTRMPGTNVTIVVSRVTTACDIGKEFDILGKEVYEVFLVGNKIEKIPNSTATLNDKIKTLYSQINSDIYVNDSLRNSMLSYLGYDFGAENE